MRHIREQINRIKNLMLISEQPVPFLRRALTKYAAEGGVETLVKNWDNIFRSDDYSRDVINSTKNLISQGGENAVRNLSDDTLGTLIRFRNPTEFAEFILKSYGISKNMDRIFSGAEKLLIQGKKVDLDALKQKIIDTIDDVEGIDDILGLKQSLYDKVDEGIEAVRNQNYSTTRPLQAGVTNPQALIRESFPPEVVEKISKLEGMETALINFIKKNANKSYDEVADEVKTLMDKRIEELSSSNLQKKIEWYKNTRGMSNTRKLAFYLQEWYKKYDASFLREKKGMSWAKSIMAGPGLLSLYAFLFQLVLINGYRLMQAGGSAPDTEWTSGILAPLLYMIGQLIGVTFTEVGELALGVSEEEAKKFAENNEDLKHYYTNADEWVFEVLEDGWGVRMMYFGQDTENNPDFIIRRKAVGGELFYVQKKEDTDWKDFLKQELDKWNNQQKSE